MDGFILIWYACPHEINPGITQQYLLLLRYCMEINVDACFDNDEK